MRGDWSAARLVCGTVTGTLLAREGCMVATSAMLAGYTAEAVAIGVGTMLLGALLVFWAVTA